MDQLNYLVPELTIPVDVTCSTNGFTGTMSCSLIIKVDRENTSINHRVSSIIRDVTFNGKYVSEESFRAFRSSFINIKIDIAAEFVDVASVILSQIDINKEEYFELIDSIRNLELPQLSQFEGEDFKVRLPFMEIIEE